MDRLKKIIDFKISLGAIIQIVSVIFLFGQMFQKVEILQGAVTKQESTFVRKDVQEVKDRLTEERFQQILAELREIKGRMK